MQDQQQFLILGRNPALSLAEIKALLGETEHHVDSLSKDVLIMTAKTPLEQFMARLGGTIKIGQIVIQNCHLENGRFVESALIQQLTDLIASNLPQDKKLFFGLSIYGPEENTQLPSIKTIQILGLEIKRNLKERGFKARFVSSRERALSSVIVQTNHLINHGMEICLFFKGNDVMIGRTLKVQEFREASSRDFGRPAREMKVGMLPIQLAKIMINLAGQPPEAAVLDPFCGLGTILTEAALMGYKNLIGSDANPEMIKATKQNLTWLGEKFQVSPPKADAPRVQNREFQVLQIDTRQLSKRITPSSINAIVTEPHMGPTNQASSFSHQASGLIRELSDLYINTFSEFKKIMKPGGRVVFVFPVFKHGQQLIKTSTQCLPQIKKFGFEPIDLLSSKNTPTFSITYSRPDQKVLREIFVFVRNF